MYTYFEFEQCPKSPRRRRRGCKQAQNSPHFRPQVSEVTLAGGGRLESGRRKIRDFRRGPRSSRGGADCGGRRSQVLSQAQFSQRVQALSLLNTARRPLCTPFGQTQVLEQRRGSLLFNAYVYDYITSCSKVNCSFEASLHTCTIKRLEQKQVTE